MNMQSVWVAIVVSLLAWSNFPNTSCAADRETAVALLTGVEKLSKAGQPEKALEMCARAEEADPDCPEVFLLKGTCLEALRRSKEALECLAKAELLANREKNPLVAQKARALAEKVCPGLLRVAEADRKLHSKLLPLGLEALEAGQLETAADLLSLALTLQPDQPQAKEALERCQSALALRGDPIASSVAEAMLAEVWYLTGIGKRQEAQRMAQELASRHAATGAGKEAAALLGSNFKAPDAKEQAALKGQLLAAQGKAKGQPVSSPAQNPQGPATPPTPRSDGASVPAPRTGPLDIATLDRSASAEARRLPKDQLPAQFQEAYKKGLEFYGQAAPGMEGSQQNLAKALEQFLRCEALGLRLEEERMLTAELAQDVQQASMLRYGCMKMAILRN